jgi:hypothetical protein
MQVGIELILHVSGHFVTECGMFVDSLHEQLNSRHALWELKRLPTVAALKSS